MVNVVDFFFLSVLFIGELVSKWIYKLGTVNMSNFFNSPLQELLGPSPSTILIIAVCIKNIFHMVVDKPQNIIPQFKVCKVNSC